MRRPLRTGPEQWRRGNELRLTLTLVEWEEKERPQWKSKKRESPAVRAVLAAGPGMTASAALHGAAIVATQRAGRPSVFNRPVIGQNDSVVRVGASSGPPRTPLKPEHALTESNFDSWGHPDSAPLAGTIVPRRRR